MTEKILIDTGPSRRGWQEYMQQHLAAVAGSNHVARQEILQVLNEILMETALVPKHFGRFARMNVVPRR